MESLHKLIVFMMTMPIVAYYFIVEYAELFLSINRHYSDKLFLKRIGITEAEFPQFIEFKNELIRQRFKPACQVGPIFIDNGTSTLEMTDDYQCEVDMYPDGCK